MELIKPERKKKSLKESPLTERQLEILKFISEYIKEKGYPPSYRDMMAGVGISSTNGIRSQLKSMMDKGCIRRDPYTFRGVVILEKGRKIVDDK